MNPLFTAAAEIQNYLKGKDERFCFIGAFALQHRVVLLNSATGIPIDVALGGVPFEERCVGRAAPFDFGIATLLTCSAEDLVVLKAFAGRQRDWTDIESVVIRQARHLDWSLVLEEFSALAEIRGGAEAMARLHRLRQAVP